MLEVDSLTFQYPGAAQPAVHEVSFAIDSAQVFGFLGPSGAGKTTVQKIMTKLLPLQQGHVRYDGRELDALNRDFFAEVGVSFEHPNLFPRLTGLENLRAFAGLYGAGQDDPRELLERVGLGDAADKKAQDYSKGMKQRLVFVRALLHRPRYLFLDEPTSGLDPATARVADALSDKIAFLHRGTIAACDTPRALKLMHGERSVAVEHRQHGVLTRETLFLDDEDDRRYLASLTRAGEIETMHSQEATLDAIFVKLTVRHKLVHVTVVIALLFGALIAFVAPEQLEHGAREVLTHASEQTPPTVLRPGHTKPPFNESLIPIMFALDLCVLGFMFAAVMVLQDKEHGTIRAYRVTPGGSLVYIASKLTVNLGLSLLNLLILVGLAAPWALAKPGVHLLVLLTCAGMTLLGIGLAAFFRTIAQFFYPLALVGLLGAAPMYTAMAPSPALDWTFWLPTYHVLFGAEALMFDTDPTVVTTALVFASAFTTIAAAFCAFVVHGRLMKEVH